MPEAHKSVSDSLTMAGDFTVGLPHLDFHTLSEDFALGHSMDCHWKMLANSLGLKASNWFDRKGDRMYAAAIYLSTWFDLEHPVGEDDECRVNSEMLAVRKPHALSTTRFLVNDTCRAEVRILTSFVKRNRAGSNKKLSVTRDIWLEEDFGGSRIDEILENHHQAKSMPDLGKTYGTTEINRAMDFNAADLFYFKNFVRIGKAMEWRQNRGSAPQLNVSRECYYYGNADDGEMIETRVARERAGGQTSHHTADGKRIFLSSWTAQDLANEAPD